MKAMFDNVKAFAVFNAKPHLFAYGRPYQLTVGADQPVYVDHVSGPVEGKTGFEARARQFGATVLIGEPA